MNELLVLVGIWLVIGLVGLGVLFIVVTTISAAWHTGKNPNESPLVRQLAGPDPEPEFSQKQYLDAVLAATERAEAAEAEVIRLQELLDATSPEPLAPEFLDARLR